MTNRLFSLAGSRHSPYELYYLQTLFASLSGLANAVAYGLTNVVIQAYKMRFGFATDAQPMRALAPGVWTLHTDFRFFGCVQIHNNALVAKTAPPAPHRARWE